MPEHTLPYHVLIIDDAIGTDSWGSITKGELEDNEFIVTHVSTAEQAKTEISRVAYDIIIIDVDLQTSETGIDLQKELRRRGLRHPVILVSGNPDFLSRPISEYADALALGPTSFYDKTTKGAFLDVVREVSNRVDPIRRVLRLMKDAGLGNKKFTVDDRDYMVAELIESSLTSDDLVRTLRESLYALVLEKQAKVTGKK